MILKKIMQMLDVLYGGKNIYYFNSLELFVVCFRYLSLFPAGTPGKTPHGLCRSSSEEANPEEAKDFTQTTMGVLFPCFLKENSVFFSAKNM